MLSLPALSDAYTHRPYEWTNSMHKASASLAVPVRITNLRLHANLLDTTITGHASRLLFGQLSAAHKAPLLHRCRLDMLQCLRSCEKSGAESMSGLQTADIDRRRWALGLAEGRRSDAGMLARASRKHLSIRKILHGSCLAAQLRIALLSDCALSS